MEIIKLFPEHVFMPVSKFPHLTILLFSNIIQDLWSVQGVFQRNQQQKLGILHWERKGEKTQMVKVAKSCHQVTWAQKSVIKKRES